MRCPTCAYEFDPARGVTCLRCGGTLDCTAVDCETCGACSGLFADLRRWLGSADRPGEGDENS